MDDHEADPKSFHYIADEAIKMKTCGSSGLAMSQILECAIVGIGLSSEERRDLTPLTARVFAIFLAQEYLRTSLSELLDSSRKADNARPETSEFRKHLRDDSVARADKRSLSRYGK